MPVPNLKAIAETECHPDGPNGLTGTVFQPCLRRCLSGETRSSVVIVTIKDCSANLSSRIRTTAGYGGLDALERVGTETPGRSEDHGRILYSIGT